MEGPSPIRGVRVSGGIGAENMDVCVCGAVPQGNMLPKLSNMRP